MYFLPSPCETSGITSQAEWQYFLSFTYHYQFLLNVRQNETCCMKTIATWQKIKPLVSCSSEIRDAGCG